MADGDSSVESRSQRPREFKRGKGHRRRSIVPTRNQTVSKLNVQSADQTRASASQSKNASADDVDNSSTCESHNSYDTAQAEWSNVICDTQDVRTEHSFRLLGGVVESQGCLQCVVFEDEHWTSPLSSKLSSLGYLSGLLATTIPVIVVRVQYVHALSVCRILEVWYKIDGIKYVTLPLPTVVAEAISVKLCARCAAHTQVYATVRGYCAALAAHPLFLELIAQSACPCENRTHFTAPWNIRGKDLCKSLFPSTRQLSPDGFLTLYQDLARTFVPLVKPLLLSRMLKIEVRSLPALRKLMEALTAADRFLRTVARDCMTLRLCSGCLEVSSDTPTES